MGTVYFETSVNAPQSVDFKPGETLMQVALGASVPGIEAACGGNCSCATCHVVIAPATVNKVPPVSEDENDLLDGVAAERQANSRLACQISLPRSSTSWSSRSPKSRAMLI
jgi:2Fe-2S ferredoxin